MIGSPQQLGQILFEKLGLSRKRRGKTGFSTDARVLQAIRDEHPIIPKIERFRELSEARPDLPRRAARLDRRRRPPAHDVPAGHRRHRPAREHQPEPPEHPDPHRDRPRDPRLLRRRARQRADLRRLLAGRAARARPHRQRAGAARHLPARRGRPHRDRRRRLRHRPGEPHGRHAHARRRWSTTGSSTGSPPTGSPTACRSSRTRRRSSSTATSRASRPSRSSWPTRSRRPRSTATSSTLFGRRRQIPEIRARNWQTRKLGERLAVNSVIQGTAADIIKVAMVRSPRRAARRRPPDPLHPADPRRAAVRGAGGRGRARDRDRRAARWSAPPRWTRRSRSTSGVGPNWLDAK